jgi:hypothetical protein
LALDETMRSVRFLGDRAFVTTARTIDPLYAIDLTDPERPEAIGHITLPGFTSYVHPIGENYLLTVGQNTPNGISGPTQVSIFDVSNLNQPRRVAEYTFERFSFSESQVDHHAFGFFAAHGLLAMPTQRNYFERVDTDGDGYRETRQQVVDNELAVFRVDVTASDPSQRLVLETEIAHDSPVRRSGYIGDKLYSIANDSVKVVDVANLDEVIASVDVSPEVDPLPPVFVPVPGSPWIVLDDLNAVRQAITIPTTSAPPLARAIENARKHLAAHLGKADGAPLLVTAEAAPDAPGGGWCLVFRVGETEFLYRASEAGLVQLVDATFEFGGGGAWNAVDFTPSRSPAGMAGDFDLDGCVSDADLAAWRQSFGTISLVSRHAADANRNGAVDAADYTVWRSNLGRIAGDFDGNGAVDDEDLAFWKSNFGASSGPGLAADGNGDGRVDAADYTIWRNAATVEEPVADEAAMEAGSGSASMLTLAASEEPVAEQLPSNTEIRRPALRTSPDAGVRSFEVSIGIASRSSGGDRITSPRSEAASPRSEAASLRGEAGVARPDALLLAIDERFGGVRRPAKVSITAVDEAIESIAESDEFGSEWFAYAALVDELELVSCQ